MNKFHKRKFKTKEVDDLVLVDYLKTAILAFNRMDQKDEVDLQQIFSKENSFINDQRNTEFVLDFDERGFWVTIEMTPSANMMKLVSKNKRVMVPIMPGFVNNWLNSRFGIFKI